MDQDVPEWPLAGGEAGTKEETWDAEDYAWDPYRLTPFSRRSPTEDEEGGEQRGTSGPSGCTATAATRGNSSPSRSGGGVSPLLWVSQKTNKLPRGPLNCQVEGCGKDLLPEKSYYQRYRVCEQHLKMLSLMVDGRPSRFCQQCGRFHDLTDFDGNKRSCRTRLQQHNARRRKREPAARPVLTEANPEMMKRALSDAHASKSSGYSPKMMDGAVVQPLGSMKDQQMAYLPPQLGHNQAAGYPGMTSHAPQPMMGAMPFQPMQMQPQHSPMFSHAYSAPQLSQQHSMLPAGFQQAPTSLPWQYQSIGQQYHSAPSMLGTAPVAPPFMPGVMMGVAGAPRVLQPAGSMQPGAAGLAQGQVAMSSPTLPWAQAPQAWMSSGHTMGSHSAPPSGFNAVSGPSSGTGFGRSISDGLEFGMGLGSMGSGCLEGFAGNAWQPEATAPAPNMFGAGQGPSTGATSMAVPTAPAFNPHGFMAQPDLSNGSSSAAPGCSNGGGSGSGCYGGASGGGGFSVSGEYSMVGSGAGTSVSGPPGFGGAGQPNPSHDGPTSAASSDADLAAELLSAAPGMSSLDIARALVAGGNNPPPYNTEEAIVRVSLKLANCTPDQLPPDLFSKLQNLLASLDASMVQGFMRPGCTHLVLDVALHSRTANCAGRHAWQQGSFSAGSGCQGPAGKRSAAELDPDALAATLGAELLARHSVLVQRDNLVTLHGTCEASLKEASAASTPAPAAPRHDAAQPRHQQPQQLQQPKQPQQQQPVVQPEVWCVSPVAAMQPGHGDLALYAAGTGLLQPGARLLLRMQGGYLPVKVSAADTSMDETAAAMYADCLLARSTAAAETCGTTHCSSSGGSKDAGTGSARVRQPLGDQLVSRPQPGVDVVRLQVEWVPGPGLALLEVQSPCGVYLSSWHPVVFLAEQGQASELVLLHGALRQGCCCGGSGRCAAACGGAGTSCRGRSRAARELLLDVGRVLDQQHSVRHYRRVTDGALEELEVSCRQGPLGTHAFQRALASAERLRVLFRATGLRQLSAVAAELAQQLRPLATQAACGNVRMVGALAPAVPVAASPPAVPQRPGDAQPDAVWPGAVQPAAVHPDSCNARTTSVRADGSRLSDEQGARFFKQGTSGSWASDTAAAAMARVLPLLLCLLRCHTTSTVPWLAVASASVLSSWL